MSFAVVARNAVLIGCVAVLIRFVTIPAGPVPINVRWSGDVSAERRAALESDLGLVDGRLIDGTTWSYSLPDASRGSIRAIIDHPAVADTHHIDRAAARPVDAPGGGVAAYLRAGVFAGLLGALAVAFVTARPRVRVTPVPLAVAADLAPMLFIAAVIVALILAASGSTVLWPAGDVTLVQAAYEADLAHIHKKVLAGADLDAPASLDGRMLTPLEAAVMSGDARAVRLLLDGGATLDAATRDRLVELATEGGAGEIEALLRRDAHPR